MGFNVTPLAQKARTKTLIADSDLNLGIYDLIATDVKGDTAEFDEFVGGVGNFSNVLGSGNLDIEGTGNIKGLTTFQNAVQVNGSLHVEGSINNVNIADNGEITTSQGVNGADFNGAKITSTKFNGATIASNGNITAGTYNGVVLKTNGTITVTPNNTEMGFIPTEGDADSVPAVSIINILPVKPNITYSGSIIIKNITTVDTTLYWQDGKNEKTSAFPIVNEGESYTLSFTSVPYLTLSSARRYALKYCGFTLS